MSEQMRELVAKWRGDVVPFDVHDPRKEGYAKAAYKCADDLESLAPKYERVVEALRIAASTFRAIPDVSLEKAATSNRQVRFPALGPYTAKEAWEIRSALEDLEDSE